MNQNRIFDVFEVIVPPLPIPSQFYRCDKVFHHFKLLEPLYYDYNQYGVVLIAGDEAKLYSVSGTNYQLVNSVHIYRMNKHKCGGQSSVRFMHIRQNQLIDYIKQVTDCMNSTWIKDSVVQVAGIVICGMAEMKDLLIDSKSSTMNPKLRQVIRKVLTCSTTNLTMNYVLEQSQDILGECDVAAESKVVQELMDQVVQQIDEKQSTVRPLIYGPDEIKTALQNQMVKTLYLHKQSSLFGECKQLAQEQSHVQLHIVTVFNEIASLWLTSYGGIMAETWFAVHND
jgi:peptide subunit release factor 1 (eRF1)